ncbi:MAG: hypothetical protein RLZZ245_2763, partial [Verrucomicrobiota bacterium]
MRPPDSLTFLPALYKRLWTAADKLRSNVDAVVDKHAVLGLIFPKHVLGSFAQRHAEITVGVLPSGCASVTGLAGRQITVKSGKASDYKITPTSKLIDDGVEKQNPNGVERHRRPSKVAHRVRAGVRIKLKNVLNKNYTQLQIDPATGSSGFFVQSERFIEEHGGTIGDIVLFGRDQWAWGAHLRRAQRARRVRPWRMQPNQCKLTTWRLAAMNMAIRGIDFGKEPADTFIRDQHPDLRADFAMAVPRAAARSHSRSHPADRPNGRINPHFNIKEWWNGKLESDVRWKYGTPPIGNANFPWIHYMLHHLAPNGSMSSNSSGEGDIRGALIEADLAECMAIL